MPGAVDPLALSALEQAAAIERGEIGCEELTAWHLDRIARLDPGLAAFVTVFGRSARRRARALDRARRSRDERPVFFGVPCGIKDIDPVRGRPMKAGSRAFRYVVSPFDGEAVRRIRAAGVVLLGKLATSELAILPVTEPDIHPPTRNPFRPGHTAGGSSGGSAAAVAAGMLPIAHASDGAGSIRIPAAFCHLFGIKPSRALVPNFYRRSEPLGLAGTGPVAHTVADAAAMLDVLRGQPRPHRDPRSLLARHRESPGRLRVRVCTRSPLAEPDPSAVAAVERAAEALRDAGHHVEAGPFVEGRVEEFLPVMQRMVANVPVLWDGFFQPLTRWMHREGRKVDRAEARRIFEHLAERILAWSADVDVVLTPTTSRPAPPVGAFDGLAPREAFLAAAELGVLTAPFNLSGQPAASVPMGLHPEGLPLGVQVVGRPVGDLTVLQVCRQLEQALPWRDRRPALG
ncbi:MAG: amidase [Myxococcales bacterium]|nr:amidase [Myxococcales bacterium]